MYDPRRAYYERMTSVAKANLHRRKQHQFSDSLGGCSSNYHE